jgi:hypothetical protein
MDKDEIAWDVLLNGEIIDTVFYDSSFTKKQVKEDLINKGFDTDIKLQKNTHW